MLTLAPAVRAGLLQRIRIWRATRLLARAERLMARSERLARRVAEMGSEIAG